MNRTESNRTGGAVGGAVLCLLLGTGGGFLWGRYWLPYTPLGHQIRDWILENVPVSGYPPGVVQIHWGKLGAIVGLLLGLTVWLLAALALLFLRARRPAGSR